MILIATKSSLTIKNIAHLTIDIKFNVSFMRNNSFYEKYLTTLTTFPAKLKKCVLFQV